MWYNTTVTKRLGIDYPILQGPFGGNLSSVQLVSAVSNAGGLGGFGAYTLSPQQIVDLGRQLKAATDKPFNINLWVSDTDFNKKQVSDEQLAVAHRLFEPYFDALGIPMPGTPAPYKSLFENQVDAILAVQPSVFSFVFGVPAADVLEACRRNGIVTVGAATTVAEAVALEEAGVDLIVASGFEAGGHRPSFLDTAERSTIGTFVLVQLIKEKVKTPVIAAGGIANGNGVAAALTLGADAVQVGTAFLATEESNASARHRDLLFSDAAQQTILSRAFTGRLGRGIMSKLAADLVGHEKELLPFPVQRQFMATLTKAATAQGRDDMIHYWAGQIAPALKHKRATELMEALVTETSAILKR